MTCVCHRAGTSWIWDQIYVLSQTKFISLWSHSECLGCFNKKKCITHRFRIWQVPDQGTSAWWEPVPYRLSLLCVPTKHKEENRLLQAFFLKILIPFTRIETLWATHLLKSPPFNITTVGISFNTNFGTLKPLQLCHDI